MIPRLRLAPWLISTSAMRQIKSCKNTIPVLKGSLAYVLFFIIFFIRPFEDLFPISSAGSSAMLVIILGFPGWSVDACLHSLCLGMFGAGVGGLNFLILGYLAPHPVAQAVLFFIMTYVPALLKMKKPSYLVFSLYCICMSWNGVYSSSSSANRQYSPELLTSFLQTYAWGAAIVVFVNVLILPHSSEAELRTTLVHCIDHVRTLAFLIKKTYWCEITAEESQVRDDLVQSIRADRHILKLKLSRTFLEITHSKWSGDDYRKMVQLTTSMQQSLISTHSNLSHMEQSEAKIFIDQVIATGSVNPELLRKYLNVGLTEVQRELAIESESAPFKHQEMEVMKEIGAERLSNKGTGSKLKSSSRHSAERDASAGKVDAQESSSQLRDIRNTLETYEGVPGTINQSLICRTTGSPDCYLTSSDDLTVPPSSSRIPQSTQVNSSIRQLWADLQILQHELIGQMFKSGKVYHPQEPLLIDLVASSVERLLACQTSEHQATRPPASNPTENRRPSLLQPILARVDGILPDKTPTSLASTSASEKTPDHPQEELNKDELQRSLLRTFSHSCIMGMFLEELIELRELVIGTMGDETQPRQKKLHIAFLKGIRARFGFRKYRKPEVENPLSLDNHADERMSMQEALETLKGKQYVPDKKTLLDRALLIEQFLRTPDSICAAKVACAVTTLAILYWSDSTREFAVTYNINTAILPLVFAINPTLGQSWLSFILQISGAAIGLLYGTMVLEIFRNVGGHKYNPYGIIAAMTLFSVPMNYLLYTKPKLFIMSALSMISAGTLIYPIYLSQNTAFDSPAQRMGKNLTSLAVALAIVSLLQLLVLRNPARRTLRKAVANLMRANTAYTVILQAYVSSTIPIDPRHRPPPYAIQRVARDLIKREVELQDDITALMPLMKFAGVEPSLGKPFNVVEYSKIARANQLILDRNRDARIAIGTTPLPKAILTEFVEKLAPYRGPALSRINTSFYLCTSTLQSKVAKISNHLCNFNFPPKSLVFPLPETLNSTGNGGFGQDIFHDALVLACRLAASPEGLLLVKSKEWPRYWLYLSSINSSPYQLASIQESAQKLFGRLEDETFR
ncbi:hypothetical protein Pst134EA_020816 [Puccinia striiformis f. sp. tritici]|uniref:hypothetical protein n=1 Tax=Puccinia striiformis f. sp. tritici TaxID=168172 RepID=UPI0020073E11|nr:hypothetical protein Pst134EA_020816 [Puccinia striiformis f. sp. tritici]KAH9456908.1 hypothetical protein Pst134EA_020816 [Puccinia striiformis f. sp. tritici]